MLTKIEVRIIGSKNIAFFKCAYFMCYDTYFTIAQVILCKIHL
jgi:hypothetical protein